MRPKRLRVPGVLQVLTHENSPLPAPKRTYVDEAGSPGETFIPFRDNSIKFSHQPVALVLADNFELARYAASLVHIEYDHEAHLTDLEAALGDAYDPPWRVLLPPIPKPRGDAEKALAASAVRVDADIVRPRNITTRWSRTRARRSGKTTGRSRSTTRRRG